MATAKLPVTLAAFLLLCLPAAMAKTKQKKPEPADPRADYVARLQRQTAPQVDTRTLGSLWTPSTSFADLSSDYRARVLNDSIIVRVAVQTAAAATGNLTSQRSFQAQSGISGLAGDVATKGINPLLNAQSGEQLKGTGQTANNSSLTTNLTGRVIAVLANGELVVEAQRQIYMNREHETMIVRGVVRPNDIATDNSVSSTQLGNLEIELKGKGVITDSTRPPNPLTRMILKIFGF
jgi:flagellar L-ring protein precursor FlgH